MIDLTRGLGLRHEDTERPDLRVVLNHPLEGTRGRDGDLYLVVIDHVLSRTLQTSAHGNPESFHDNLSLRPLVFQRPHPLEDSGGEGGLLPPHDQDRFREIITGEVTRDDQHQEGHLHMSQETTEEPELILSRNVQSGMVGG